MGLCDASTASATWIQVQVTCNPAAISRAKAITVALAASVPAAAIAAAEAAAVTSAYVVKAASLPNHAANYSRKAATVANTHADAKPFIVISAVARLSSTEAIATVADGTSANATTNTDDASANIANGCTGDENGDSESLDEEAGTQTP